MDLMEAIRARHSVRQYTDQPIPAEVAAELRAEIEESNQKSGLHMQLVTDDAKAFDAMMAHYGKFSGVRNYLALVGSKCLDLEEKCGYWGERIVLMAQALGLNSCWVGLTFGKGAAKSSIQMAPGEKLVVVVALGYGTTQGTARKTKSFEELTQVAGELPEWFRAGVEAAQLAPTAMNQQKFRLHLEGDAVRAENLGGFFSKVDLGIVKCHFELASGHSCA